MDDMKTRRIEDGAFPVDEELAGVVPMAMPAEQATLTAHIKEYGQKEPIVLWKGKVVDGRCRQKALVSLGRHISYKELDSGLSRSDVEVYVKAVNTRRNLTSSQKVAAACKEYLRSKGVTTQLKVAKSWGISTRILLNAIWLHELDSSIIQTVFDGGTIAIVDSNGKHKLSNKITSIYAHYKRVQEAVVEDSSNGWKESSSIHTQAGKDWYYETVSSNSVGSIAIKVLLAELANYKFK